MPWCCCQAVLFVAILIHNQDFIWHKSQSLSLLSYKIWIRNERNKLHFPSDIQTLTKMQNFKKKTEKLWFCVLFSTRISVFFLLFILLTSWFMSIKGLFWCLDSQKIERLIEKKWAAMFQSTLSKTQSLYLEKMFFLGNGKSISRF